MSKSTLTAEAVCDHSAAYIANLLSVSVSEIDPEADYDRIGLDSVMAVSLILELEQWSGIELQPSLLFEYPNLRELSEHIAELAKDGQASDAA